LSGLKVGIAEILHRTAPPETPPIAETLAAKLVPYPIDRFGVKTQRFSQFFQSQNVIISVFHGVQSWHWLIYCRKCGALASKTA
jgi:hypothetical protein